MRAICWIICLIAMLISCPCWAKDGKEAADSSKPLFFEAIKRIALGRIFNDPKAKNVSLSIRPTGASFRISF